MRSCQYNAYTNKLIYLKKNETYIRSLYRIKSFDYITTQSINIMTDLLTSLPLDMQYEIANKVDLQTIPCFMATCSSISSHFTNDFYTKLIVIDVVKRINNVIDVIKDYHTLFHSNDVQKRIAKQLLKHSFHMFENSKQSWNIVSLSNLWNDIIREVIVDIGCSYDDVLKAWIKMNRNLTLRDEEQVVVDSLMKTLMKPPNKYDLTFEHVDSKGQGRYYIQFSLSLKDINNPIASFAIQDIITEREQQDDCKELVSMIPTAVMDQDGFININLTNENLKGMVEYIVKVFGTETFMFEPDLVSYIEVGSMLWYGMSMGPFNNIINQEMSADVFRDKIIDILN